MRKLKADVMQEASPWLFQGEPFVLEEKAPWEGFVYLITNLTNGRMYVGRKYFWQLRKAPGKKRRSRSESDWRAYFSSCDELKEDVKRFGPENFKREILSLHTLKRDVNYMEVREMFRRDVLDTLDSQGNRVYYNENIQGKFYPKLVIGLQDRSSIT